MNTASYSRVLCMGALIILSLFGCNDVGEFSGDTARLEVVLVDAPANFGGVFIEILDVQVRADKGNDEKGWVSLEGFEPGVYNLLSLVNGEEAFMGVVELPEGQLAQIRLILGENNFIGDTEEILELKVPSGSQSGLKLQINETIEAGVSYKLVIDFDAGQSIIPTKGGQRYILKPVLRASLEAQAGSVSGIVAPSTLEAIVYAINSEEDTVSSYPDDTGGFMIRSLKAGEYKVVAVSGEANGLDKITKDGVQVLVGEDTDIGTFDFAN